MKLSIPSIHIGESLEALLRSGVLTAAQLPKSSRNDERLARIALECNPENAGGISETLWGQPDFAKFALTQSLSHQQFLSPSLKDDEEFQLQECMRPGFSLQHVSLRLRDQDDFVFMAITLEGMNLRWASERLRSRPEFVLRAMLDDRRPFPSHLQFASMSLRDDRSFMQRCVESRGLLLEHASARLRHSKEFVFKALCSDSNAYKFASEELKLNKDIFRQATLGSWKALIHAPECIRKNKDEMEYLVLRHPRTARYVPGSRSGDKLENV